MKYFQIFFIFIYIYKSVEIKGKVTFNPVLYLITGKHNFACRSLQYKKI